jgi:hypothetical protein
MAIGFEAGEAALALNPKPAFGFRSTANPVLLPEAKPRTISEHFVVPSIRSREVTRVQRSGVRHRKGAALTTRCQQSSARRPFVPISDMGVAIVKRSGPAHSHSGPLEPFPR